MDPFLTPPRCSHRAAQLGSAQLSLAWLGSAQLSSAQLAPISWLCSRALLILARRKRCSIGQLVNV